MNAQAHKNFKAVTKAAVAVVRRVRGLFKIPRGFKVVGVVPMPVSAQSPHEQETVVPSVEEEAVVVVNEPAQDTIVDVETKMAVTDMVVVEETEVNETKVEDVKTEVNETKVEDVKTEVNETVVETPAQAQPVPVLHVTNDSDDDDEDENLSPMALQLRAMLRQRKQRIASANTKPVVVATTTTEQNEQDALMTKIQPVVEHLYPVSTAIAIGVVSRRAAVAESLNTTFEASAVNESAIDLGDLDDVMEETLAAPKRNLKVRCGFGALGTSTNVPTINCDIASYALQQSKMVDIARARVQIQRESSSHSLTSQSTATSGANEEAEVREEEWN